MERILLGLYMISQMIEVNDFCSQGHRNGVTQPASQRFANSLSSSNLDALVNKESIWCQEPPCSDWLICTWYRVRYFWKSHTTRASFQYLNDFLEPLKQCQRMRYGTIFDQEKGRTTKA